MRICPFCNLEIDESDLSRQYLKELSILSFISMKHPNWTPEQGACSRCLDALWAELQAQSMSGKPRPEVSDERTIITEAPELIEEQKVPEHGACLITIHGTDLGREYDLEEETLIGRAENAQVRINEENVSRLHAIIFKRGAEIVLEDQNSTNGTFVNTRKIKSKPLKDGDLILIGNTILKFMSGSTVEHHYHEEIYRLATVDGLTKAHNKNFFLQRLEDEFSRSRRYGRDFSLLMYDFDHFKQLNDVHGHLAGDEVLRKTTGLILRNLRKEDVCGRYGGEEFGIILPETSRSNAIQLAQKLRKLVEGTTYEWETKKIKATISVGVAALSKDQRASKQLLEKADKALYQAKNDGRNCVRF